MAEHIPGTDQVRKALDGIEPGELFPAKVLEAARERGVLESYRVLEGTMPAALEGAWYFSSKEIHCGRRLTMTAKKRDGTEDGLYYHEAVCAAAA